jgi:hypothetical protein
MMRYSRTLGRMDHWIEGHHAFPVDSSAGVENNRLQPWERMASGPDNKPVVRVGEAHTKHCLEFSGFTNTVIEPPGIYRERSPSMVSLTEMRTFWVTGSCRRQRTFHGLSPVDSDAHFLKDLLDCSQDQRTIF